MGVEKFDASESEDDAGCQLNFAEHIVKVYFAAGQVHAGERRQGIMSMDERRRF